MQEAKPRILTPEEIARINKALADHAPNFKKCPMCDSEMWGIVGAPHNITLAQRTSGSLMLSGGLFVPLLPLICQVCGYAAFFSMYQLGIQDMFGLGQPEQMIPETEQSARMAAIQRALDRLKSGEKVG